MFCEWSIPNHFITQYIYIRTVSSQHLLSTFLIQFKLVYGPFWQGNIDSTLNFYPRPERKETNAPLQKRSLELTVLIYIQCLYGIATSLCGLKRGLDVASGKFIICIFCNSKSRMESFALMSVSSLSKVQMNLTLMRSN